MMNIPAVLRILGIHNGELKIYGSFFKHALDPKHAGMDETVLRNLPKAMADPLMVLYGNVEQDEVGYSPQSYLFILEVENNIGATVVVPVHIQKKDFDDTVADIVVSAYGKNDIATNKKPDYRWLIDAIHDGNIFYLNKRKSTAWAGTIQSTASQQHPSNGSASPADHGLISAISEYSVDDNNIPVKTEKDLADFKKANAGKYALEDEADVTTFTNEELTNQVLTAYPTAQNVETTDNGVTFTLPNGMRITHNYEDQNLVAEEETAEASKAYGRNVKSGEGAFGKTTIVNEGAVVSLTRDNKSGTVDHEAHIIQCLATVNGQSSKGMPAAI